VAGFQVCSANHLSISWDEIGFYRDAFGNVIEGVAPKRKESRYYIDSSGYVVELAEGQEAPQSSGNSLVDWINTVDVANDPEVREALGENNLFFEEAITVGENEVLVTGKLESRGWIVDTESENEKLNLSFRLSRSLSRDEAIGQAAAYLESKAGPRFKNLTDNELRMVERLAIQDRVAAFIFHLQSRLPDDLAEKFLELGAQGNELMILQFAADERVSELAEEAVAHSFYFSTPRASENFFDWVRANDGGRMWTFALLDSLWNQFNLNASIDRLRAEPQPTPEDLDALSDKEIEETLTEARKLRARNQIR
jgi:hypothetical protein